MADCLEIVSSRLLIANVRVDTGITSRSSEILALSEWDMLSVGVLIALGETEIDNEDIIFVVLVSSDQEVVWFDISVNYSLFMNFLNTLNLKY